MIPVVRKTSRNFLCPMNFSRIEPNNKRAKRFKTKCPSPPWRKIAVTKRHGWSQEDWFRTNRLVMLRKSWARKTRSIIPESLTA